MHPPTVHIEAVTQGPWRHEVEGLGFVAAFYTVNVRSQVDGRIRRVLFSEGQKVRRGQALVELDPRSFDIAIHQAEAQLARDTAQHRLAELTWERNKAMADQNLVAQMTVDQALAQMQDYAGAMAQDRAQIANARLQREWSVVVAPIDGVTGVRLADPGSMVHAADTNGLVVITQLEPIAVMVTLPEDVLPQLQAALRRGPVEVTALPREGETPLGKGVVTLIDNQLNTGTGTLRLKAVFDNALGTMWPNQFVRARVTLDAQEMALQVPAQAVVQGPEGNFVRTVDGHQRVRVRPVELGLAAGGRRHILRGLEPNDWVIVEGQANLAPGSEVQPTKK